MVRGIQDREMETSRVLQLQGKLAVLGTVRLTTSRPNICLELIKPEGDDFEEVISQARSPKDPQGSYCDPWKELC